jgi:hypothetical protein
MGAGLPGFGIASVFYLLAGLLGPVRELVATPREKRSADRWRAVWRQFVMSVATVGAIVMFYAAIEAAVSRGWITTHRGPAALAGVPNFAWAVLALVVVLLVGSLYGVWVALTGGDDAPDAIAAGHRGLVLPGPSSATAQPPPFPLWLPVARETDHLAWALISLNPPDGGTGRRQAAWSHDRDAWISQARFN